MDYKKKYNDAMERAKIAYKDTDKHIKATIERIFPELLVDEDERIRMALVELLKEVEEDETYTGRQHIPDMLSYLERQKEQKPADSVSKEEYVKRFKALCDAYEIKLPNREYDIYHLCKDLHKLFGNADIQKPAWSEEDEKMLTSILWHVSYSVTNGKKTDCKCDMTEWLKSLPNRFNLSEEKFESIDRSFRSGREAGFKEGVESVRTTEWSEEDAQTISSAIYWLKRMLSYEKATDISTQDCPLSVKETLDRLSSLRPVL